MINTTQMIRMVRTLFFGYTQFAHACAAGNLHPPAAHEENHANDEEGAKAAPQPDAPSSKRRKRNNKWIGVDVSGLDAILNLNSSLPLAPKRRSVLASSAAAAQPASSLASPFVPITAEQEVSVTLAMKKSDNVMLAEVKLPRGCGHQLFVFNFKCLKRKTWLNSETIDFFFAMAKADAAFVSYCNMRHKWARDNILICHSGLMRRIAPHSNDAHPGGDYMNFTLNWAKRERTQFQVDSILSLQLWLLPYNIDDTHWVLIVVNIAAKRVTLYESFARGNHERALANVVSYLELQGGRDRMPVTRWDQEVIYTGHQCGDAYECGVFLIAHAMHLMYCEEHNIRSQCTLHNVSLFRHRIAADILNGRITLPE